jgi:hypothetical protein
MDLPQTTNKELIELESKFSDRKLLWTNMEKFYKLSEEWFNNPFKELNCEEIEIEMRNFANANVLLKTRIQNLSSTGSCRVLDTFIIEIKQI